MARDPLLTLLSMRQRAVEQARYDLGACLKIESEITGLITTLDAAVRRDREAGGTWPDAHQFLEMSAIRADSVRAQRQTAEAALAAAVSRSAEARDTVAAARSAAEAVEQLVAERKTAAAFKLATREQHALDDIARTLNALRQNGRVQ